MAKKKASSKSAKYSLLAFSVDSVIIDDFKRRIKDKNPDQLPQKEDLRFDFQFRFGIALDKGIIQLNIFMFINDPEVSDRPLVTIKTSYDFHIENIELWKSSDSLIVPKIACQSFISIGYGTLRGMLNSILAGTLFQKIVLPIMDINQLNQGDVTFNLRNITK